jgi:hypothetical protein
VDRLQLGADLGVDAAQHGLEQPRLVAEMVVQRAAGHARLGRQRVQRHFGKAARGKGRAGHRDQPVGGGAGDIGAGLAVS